MRDEGSGIRRNEKSGYPFYGICMNSVSILWDLHHFDCTFFRVHFIENMKKIAYLDFRVRGFAHFCAVLRIAYMGKM
jgi:hypothetical protein